MPAWLWPWGQKQQAWLRRQGWPQLQALLVSQGQRQVPVLCLVDPPASLRPIMDRALLARHLGRGAHRMAVAHMRAALQSKGLLAALVAAAAALDGAAATSAAAAAAAVAGASGTAGGACNGEASGEGSGV